MNRYSGPFVNHSALIASYKNPTLWGGMFSLSKFDIHEKVAWLSLNWTWSIYASIVYIILIFGGQEVMKHRKAFNLKVPMAIWNFSLAAFSFSACAVLVPEHFSLLGSIGLYPSICGTIDLISQKSLFFGSWFVLLKLFELGDTAFIVLRKRKLIFLHWYHHVSVLICVWASSKDLMSTGAWFAVVNCSVHALMYTYYGLKSMDVRVPKILAMSITVLQINQMVVGLLVNCYALWTKLKGVGCAVTDFHILLVFGMYLSYFILFGDFFIKTYLVHGGGVHRGGGKDGDEKIKLRE